MVPIGMDYGSSGGGVSPTSASNNYSFSFPSVPMAYRLERHHLVDRSLKNYVNECNSDIYNNIRDSSHDHSIR
jgi:hypothetical protein